MAHSLSAAVAVMSGTPPPLALDELVARIAPRRSFSSTPAKAEEIAFACGMNMLRGAVVVQ